MPKPFRQTTPDGVTIPAYFVISRVKDVELRAGRVYNFNILGLRGGVEMLKSRKLLIGAVIIAVALGYLGFTAFESSATYYYTVSEFVRQSNSIADKNVKVNGSVAEGSLQEGPSTRELRFILTEGGQSLPVFYEGARPDAFKVGNEVVVEGHLDTSGIFEAHTILTKCPSKYVPK